MTDFQIEFELENRENELIAEANNNNNNSINTSAPRSTYNLASLPSDVVKCL